MKILWVSHLVPYPPKGGVMQRSYNIIRELSKYNQIDFISFYQKAHHILPGSEIDAGIIEIKKICRIVEIYEIPSDKFKMKKLLNIFLGLITSKPYNVWWLKSSEFANALRKTTKDADYDIYYFDTIALAQYLSNLSSKKGYAPIKILNHHNIESQIMDRRSKKEKNVLKSFIFRLESKKRANYERRICRCFDRNVVVSELDGKRLKDIVGNIPCIIVPNGVDLEYFKSTGSVQRDNCIIFIGGLKFYPNISAIRFFLKDIWKNLKSKVPNIKFYIVGKFPPKDLIAASKKDKNIIVTGFVNDIRKLLEEATVYICPITDGGGTKLKILDALAMKKAIVAHPIACEGIDVTHGKNVMFATNENEFLSHIVELINNGKRRIQLGENARLLIEEKYAYDKICFKFNHELDSYLNNSHKQ